jgi:iron complex transport system ATP-binding protein
MQLNVNHLNFAYHPGRTVLHDVSFSVKAGETLYILGRNGGGKTTLLSCIAGLLKPNAGEVTFNDKNIQDYTDAQRAQLIGLIPQVHVPVFPYTVEEMVLMGRAPHLGWLGSPSDHDKNIVEESLEQVGISDLSKRPYTEISGGERQLVLIARGLAQRCPILLMDEPTAHLDLSNQHRILEIIQQLSRQGLSFIVSSQAPNDALLYADSVLLLSDGWVLDYGMPREIINEQIISTVYGIKTDVIYDSKSDFRVPRAIIPRRPSSYSPDSFMEPGTTLYDIFRRGEDQPQLILVSGLSGAGKTTWCSNLIQRAKEAELNVTGILSPGIFQDGKKIGIQVVDIKSDEKRQLAVLKKTERSDLSTPRWSFRSEVMEWANSKLGTLENTGDLLIIDELGPLEFLRDQGLTAGLDLIDRNNYKIAFVVVRSSLLPKALQRWPNAIVISGSLESLTTTRSQN